MNKEIFQAEQAYLHQVHQQLTTDAAALQQTMTTATAQGQAAKQTMTKEVRLNFDSFADNLDTFAAIETANREIDARNIQLDSLAQRWQAAQLLLPAPYFGRIDLRYPDETTAEPFYIGKVGYTTAQQEDLVYDWRAPVADAYYSGRFGAITYTALDREIQATLTLKRQFILHEAHLEDYLDQQTAIADPLLLAALAQNREAQMRDITVTIQAEQNAVIRNTSAQVLIVDGVAGSGKTSVLLQRVAYQLFHHRQTWRSADILLLTPSRLFAQYTAAVLPALGETNPLQVPLLQYVQQLGQQFDLMIDATALATLSVTAIESWLAKVLTPAETSATQGLAPLTAALLKTATTKSLLQRLQTVYLALADAGQAVTSTDWLHWLQQQSWWTLPTLNTAEKLYLLVRIARFEQAQIRALFIDEAQDYTAGQLALLAALFKQAQITLLGDHDQTLAATTAPYLAFGDNLPQATQEQVLLQTSYRATAGITHFFAKFADRGAGLTIGAVQPDQTPPLIQQVADATTANDWLVATLSQAQTTFSQAIIVPDAVTATRVTQTLHAAGIAAQTVVAQQALPAAAIVAVVPLPLAKGLEFDAAILWLTATYYPATVLGRHRLYVGASRATKQLTVLAVGAVPLLKTASDLLSDAAQ